MVSVAASICMIVDMVSSNIDLVCSSLLTTQEEEDQAEDNERGRTEHIQEDVKNINCTRHAGTCEKNGWFIKH